MNESPILRISKCSSKDMKGMIAAPASGTRWVLPASRSFDKVHNLIFLHLSWNCLRKLILPQATYKLISSKSQHSLKMFRDLRNEQRRQ
jgi:hypothetical protein